MQTHYSKGDRIIVKFKDGTSCTGTVQSQKGTRLKVKWDHNRYHPYDEDDEIDVREVESLTDV